MNPESFLTGGKKQEKVENSASAPEERKRKIEALQNQLRAGKSHHTDQKKIRELIDMLEEESDSENELKRNRLNELFSKNTTKGPSPE